MGDGWDWWDWFPVVLEVSEVPLIKE